MAAGARRAKRVLQRVHCYGKGLLWLRPESEMDLMFLRVPAIE
jgi:hypothetical protein